MVDSVSLASYASGSSLANAGAVGDSILGEYPRLVCCEYVLRLNALLPKTDFESNLNESGDFGLNERICLISSSSLAFCFINSCTDFSRVSILLITLSSKLKRLEELPGEHSLIFLPLLGGFLCSSDSFNAARMLSMFVLCCSLMASMRRCTSMYLWCLGVLCDSLTYDFISSSCCFFICLILSSISFVVSVGVTFSSLPCKAFTLLDSQYPGCEL
mmetsp:Transcript_13437/g.22578  ORF Transcript_13437/g.22578 Transcript_13437/m.22578 type:complete len:216 (-) Transcript_13437:5-652(-)